MKDIINKIKNNKKSKNAAIICWTLLYIFLAALLVFEIETFLRGNVLEAQNWFNDNMIEYIFNVIIIVSFLLILLACFNNYLVSFTITSCIVLLLAFMNFYKFSILGEFLYPWDLLLYNQAINILPLLWKALDFVKVIIGFSILAVIVILSTFNRKFNMIFRIVNLNKKTRFSLACIGITILLSLFFYRSILPLNNFLNKIGVANMVWAQNENYKANGFLFSFVLNMQSAILVPPKGYSKDQLSEITNKIKKNFQIEKEISGQALQKDRPNIIIIMNEAFWDPTVLENANITTDPMPTIRHYQTGWMLSPTFGGGTSNVEFEVLTGLSNSFLPKGSIPYQQYISKPIPSLASYLSNEGYEPIAIHPFYKWFWNRENVYKLLGFKQFIGVDDFVNAEHKGPYISDSEVSRAIINKTEASKDPVFIYAVTMQNHYPYGEDKYDMKNIKAEGELSKETISSLETYSQGISDADNAFKELLEYYQKLDEPTLIVFFGDHLPELGQDYATYREANYLKKGNGVGNWSLDEHKRMKSTPLVFWSNFTDEVPNIEISSAAFLAPHILDIAGVEKAPFYNFIEQFGHELPGYTKEVKVNKAGSLFKNTPREQEDLEKMYWLIQYDMLFGRQYGVHDLFTKNNE